MPDEYDEGRVIGRHSANDPPLGDEYGNRYPGLKCRWPIGGGTFTQCGSHLSKRNRKVPTCFSPYLYC